MDNKKILIELLDHETGKITINNGVTSRTKMTSIQGIISALSSNVERFDTGMIAPNVVNYSSFGNKKCVHVYIPSFVTKILHMYDVKFRDEESQVVRYPHMLFSFCSAGTSSLISEINLIGSENFHFDAPLYKFLYNNYSDSYGICWGENSRTVKDIVATQDINKLASLPYLFLNSNFNGDLNNSYYYDDDFFENHLKKWPGFSSIRDSAPDNDDYYVPTYLMFKYLGAHHEMSSDFSMYLKNAKQYKKSDTISSFINTFNVRQLGV